MIFRIKKTATEAVAILYISKIYARCNVKNYGGGRGIRTPARYDPPVGFQDRSLQPNLGIPPY